MEKKLTISYDKEADVMYLSFAEPAPAYGEEIEEGVFVRYDPDSHALVGITIVNFSQKFGKKPKTLDVPVRA